MVTRRLSDPARAGSETHAQMLSFEDSEIKVAVVSADRVRSIKLEEKELEKPIRAWIVDWADEKHNVSLYDVATEKQEALTIRQSPEALQEWLGQLRSRGTKADTSPWFWNKATAGC